jgi:hypothetical protein
MVDQVSIKLQKELDKWDERVFYGNLKFNKDNPPTVRALPKLEAIHREGMEHFVFISANTEQVVYKIGRYFIELGETNENITFIDGRIIKSFIDPKDVNWRTKANINDMFSMLGDSLRSKWVFIPLLEQGFTLEIATYFMFKFKSTDAMGVVFYSPNNHNDDLATTLIESNLTKVHQFPKIEHRASHNKLNPEDDEW